MFVTDTDVLQSLAEALHKDVGDLQPFWINYDSSGNIVGGVVPQQHAAAYNEIFERLLRRGFTPAQIVTWDRGGEFELAIAVYLCLTHGGAADPPQYDKALLDVLGQYRDKLDTLIVSSAGVWLVPGDTPGNIQFGPLETMFDLFGQTVDPCDPRIGQVVRW